MKDELLDLVNEKDEVIGTVWKSEAHKDSSKIHREIAVIIFDKTGKTLLQQRSIKKLVQPGLWTVAASGHIGKGEDPKVAAERELFEELGIKVNLKFFLKEFVPRGTSESRFAYAYYAIVEKLPELKLSPREVSDTAWIKVEDLAKFPENHIYHLPDFGHRVTMEIYSHLKSLAAIR